MLSIVNLEPLISVSNVGSIWGFKCLIPQLRLSLEDMNTTVHGISNPCRIWTPPSTGYQIPAGYEHHRPRDIKSLQDMNTTVHGISNPCRIWTPPSSGYQIPAGYEHHRPRDIKSELNESVSLQKLEINALISRFTTQKFWPLDF